MNRPQVGKSAFNPDCSTDFRSPDRKRVTVLGIGNVLLSDDGAGIHAAAVLKRRYTFSPAIDIIDGGTMALDLLPLFQDRDRILIIDAADFRTQPGHVAVLEGDAVSTVLNSKLSVHHIGLADLLFAAKLTRRVPGRIALVGIQPASLEMGLGLTALVSGKLQVILDMTIQKLKEWNVRCLVRPRDQDQSLPD